MFKIVKNNIRLEYKNFLFPGGEVGIKLELGDTNGWKNITADYQTIFARINDSNDIMRLFLITDALRRIDDCPIRLFMPYVPYGRQDRVCNRGESFSLKVFANLIKSLNFEKIMTFDPHSDVTGAAFDDNLVIVHQKDIINKFEDFTKMVLDTRAVFVSPDAGGNKKTADLAAYYGHSNFIRADKLRDLSNGNIRETIVYADNLKDETVIIADDICDGGRTFIELAKVLRAKGASQIMLYVTHGIFSKGVEALLKNGIDKIYTTNSFSEFNNSSKNVTIFDLERHFRV